MRPSQRDPLNEELFCNCPRKRNEEWVQRGAVRGNAPLSSAALPVPLATGARCAQPAPAAPALGKRRSEERT